MGFNAKVVVTFTAAILLLIFSFLLFVHHSGYEKPIPLYTKTQPTIGSSQAKVHVVSFEDPKCNNCIVYHNQDYKKLYSSYIKTGMIRYTVYLVGELPNSSIICAALLCANEQSTPSFFQLLDAYYKNPILALTPETIRNELLTIAQNAALPIDFTSLQRCVSSATFDKQVLENTNYARDIMGGVIKTPTVFVNGIRLVRPSYDQLTTLIDIELKKGSS